MAPRATTTANTSAVTPADSQRRNVGNELIAVSSSDGHARSAWACSLPPGGGGLGWGDALHCAAPHTPPDPPPPGGRGNGRRQRLALPAPFLLGVTTKLS